VRHLTKLTVSLIVALAPTLAAVSLGAAPEAFAGLTEIDPVAARIADELRAITA